MLEFKNGEGDVLPPFRSSREFPISPSSEKLPDLYSECRHALVMANEARRILRSRMNCKRDIILQIRKEIECLEADLALEASTRMQLHAFNEKLVDGLREIQDTSDEFTRIISESQHLPRNGLGSIVDKLKDIVRRWRAFKTRQREAMANERALRQHRGSDG